MYTLTVESSFSSAHALREYKGPCENLHGHTWKVAIFLSGDKLNKVVGKFDHQNLNDLPEFKSINPSCENIARIIYEQLTPAVPLLEKVTVWESPTTSATFRPSL